MPLHERVALWLCLTALGAACVALGYSLQLTLDHLDVLAQIVIAQSRAALAPRPVSLAADPPAAAPAPIEE